MRIERGLRFLFLVLLLPATVLADGPSIFPAFAPLQFELDGDGGAPSNQISVEYAFLRELADAGGNIPIGWNFSYTRNLTRSLGIVGEVGTSYESESGVSVALWDFMGGVRLSSRSHSAFTPYFEALAGVAVLGVTDGFEIVTFTEPSFQFVEASTSTSIGVSPFVAALTIAPFSRTVAQRIFCAFALGWCSALAEGPETVSSPRLYYRLYYRRSCRSYLRHRPHLTSLLQSNLHRLHRRHPNRLNRLNRPNRHHHHHHHHHHQRRHQCSPTTSVGSLFCETATSSSPPSRSWCISVRKTRASSPPRSGCSAIPTTSPHTWSTPATHRSCFCSACPAGIKSASGSIGVASFRARQRNAVSRPCLPAFALPERS